MSNEKFVHLHNHSHYSLLDGLSSPEQLIKCAVDMGYQSLAITDHGSCAGLYKFQLACNEHGIKPILGMEAYITEDMMLKEKGCPKTHHLILLAKNEIGYRNLIQLSTASYMRGFYYKPRIDFSLLEKHKEGLIVSSACAIGEIPYQLWNNGEKVAMDIAGKYKDVFGDDFYIELMMHKYFGDSAQQDKERKLCGMLHGMAKKLGTKTICTQDTHYAHADEWKMHDILLAIQTRTHIKNPKRLSFCSKDFYLKPQVEMAELFKPSPQSLLNTVEIAEKIETDLIKTEQDLLPPFELPEGYTEEETFLKDLIKDGMKKKGVYHDEKYRARINHEMSVILKCKYQKYFLILWDIINFANRQGIRVGIGRGSAVSSLCLYVLGIVKLDPLKYDLIFERFLNLDRISPPDVDLDFDHNKRDQIYDYLYHKYGMEYCAKIGTYNSYKAKASIRFTAKALDLGKDWETYESRKKSNPNSKVEMTKRSLDLADEISKQIPKEAKSIQEALQDEEGLRSYQERYPQLFKSALYIEGCLSSAGVHPAGVMACKDPIAEHIPLRVSKGVVCSQYDMHEVEELGLLKFDILAIKTLTVIDKTIKLIKARHPDDPKAQSLDVDELEPDDQKVFDVFSGKNPYLDTLGIFQMEGGSMTRLLQKLQVDSFEDIIVVNSLHRPGPLKAGVHEMFCNYKHGREEIKYIHPAMGKALQDTYGMMIYQENVMRVATEVAGFTNGQADVLRYAVGKKKEKLMAEQKDLFVEGCMKTNQISKPIAEKIFEQIDYFSGYGFNKSHAAAYAFLAYQTAYLKTYYFIEFMCSLLSNEIDNNDKDMKLNAYKTQVLRLGYRFLNPNINKSGKDFSICKIFNKRTNQEEECLRTPLSTLKGVGAKAVDEILENRPFKDLADFLRRVDGRKVNSKVFGALVDADCFREEWGDDTELTSKYDVVKKELEKEKKAEKKLQKLEDKLQAAGGCSLFDL